MSRIPPSLESYLILPPDTSLILLTSVLGASPNWLLLRYLYGVLRPEAHGGTSFVSAAPPGIGEDGVHNGPGPAAEGGTETKVILVSFIRDFASWRQYAARMGMHLEKLGRQRRFVFVDGLSWSAGVTSIARAGSPSELWLRSLAGVGGVEGIGTVIHAAMDDLRPAKPDGASGGKIVLVVDQLDFLLAASGEEVTRADLHDMLLDLREVSGATSERGKQLGFHHGSGFRRPDRPQVPVQTWDGGGQQIAKNRYHTESPRHHRERGGRRTPAARAIH